MPRHRTAINDGSLDSLLDTMTNVVGILVILMAVTQIGVGDAVRRHLSDSDAPLAEISDTAVNVLQQERDELERTLRGVKMQWEDLEAKYLAQQSSLTQIRRVIEDLRGQLRGGVEGNVDAGEMARIVAERTRQKSELDGEVNKLASELARIKAQLEETPVRQRPAAKLVTLPNPRPAPEGKTPIVFLCRDDKVYFMDEPSLLRIGEAAIRRAAPRRNAEGHVDCQQIVDYFAQRTIGDANFRLRVEAHNFTPHLVLDRTADAGETIAQIRKPESEFQSVLRREGSASRYVRFSVWPESFEAYVAARAVIDQMGWDAGWNPQTRSDEWKIRMSGDLVCIGKPKIADGKLPPPPTPGPERGDPDVVDPPPDVAGGDRGGADEID